MEEKNSSEILKEKREFLTNKSNDIKELLSELETMKNKVNYTDLSPEEKFEYDYIIKTVSKLNGLYNHIAYHESPIEEVSKLIRNEHGRYEMQSGYCFTAGDLIEIKLGENSIDSRYEKWIISRVAYDEKDYYILDYKNIDMENLIVRRRDISY